ncbi:flavoprotein [Microbacterium sp.]|uniref:flavoprotein n=1 Tax=Microbacterium sp. TaxID=51671 RepID=UPI003A8A368C
MDSDSKARNPAITDLRLDAFGYNRVVLVLTGSAVTQVMPYWIEWARVSAPETEFRVIARESAYTFTTRHNIESRLRSHVQDDRWDDEIIASHVELAEWADLILVYPATLDYVSRLAHGITDSPSLLAALSTDAQVCIAPALPPRTWGRAVVMETFRLLRQPENFIVIDPTPGPSESSDSAPAWIPPPMPEVLRRLEAHRSRDARRAAPRSA